MHSFAVAFQIQTVKLIVRVKVKLFMLNLFFCSMMLPES